MSLDAWKTNGWLREYSTSEQEIAGLQLATLVLFAAGYRTRRGESKHYRVIQALPLVMGSNFNVVRDYLDNCRRKRNVSEYDAAGTISQKELNDLLVFGHEFQKSG